MLIKIIYWKKMKLWVCYKMSIENWNMEFVDKIIVNVFFVFLMFVYFMIYKRKCIDCLYIIELKFLKYGF